MTLSVRTTADRPPAFTLIELLVVIAIIAILMGLLFPVISTVKNQSNKAKAKTEVMQIITAIKAYETEYGKFPLTEAQAEAGASGSDAVLGDPGGKYHTDDLLYILRAMDRGANAGHALNSRKIVYLEIPDVRDPKAPKGGMGADGRFYDPWGTEYMVFIDANYDNQIDLAGMYKDSAWQGTTAPRFSAGAASLGKDGRIGNKGDGRFTDSSGKASDDVISW